MEENEILYCRDDFGNNSGIFAWFRDMGDAGLICHNCSQPPEDHLKE